MAYKPEGAIGEFVECDFGNLFTYRKTTNEWALSVGFTHEVDVQNTTVFATVGIRGATICTGEKANGSPLTSKWRIKKHFKYNQDKVA